MLTNSFDIDSQITIKKKIENWKYIAYVQF